MMMSIKVCSFLTKLLQFDHLGLGLGFRVCGLGFLLSESSFFRY